MSLLHTYPALMGRLLRCVFRIGDHGDGLRCTGLLCKPWHLPSQEYLSVRDSGTSETLSAARNRGVRPLSRSVRQTAAYLFSGMPHANRHALSGLLSIHEIPSHNLCGIIITNYIHRQDGQKS